MELLGTDNYWYRRRVNLELAGFTFSQWQNVTGEYNDEALQEVIHDAYNPDDNPDVDEPTVAELWTKDAMPMDTVNARGTMAGVALGYAMMVQDNFNRDNWKTYQHEGDEIDASLNTFIHQAFLCWWMCTLFQMRIARTYAFCMCIDIPPTPNDE